MTSSKIIELDGKRVIVAITEDGTPVAQLYKEDPEAPPEPKGKTPPATVKDKVMLANWIEGQGYKRGSKEYDAMFNSHRGDLPLEYNDLLSLK